VTEAPKEIWCSTGLYYQYKQDWSEGERCDDDNGGVKYVRADRIEELHILHREYEKLLRERIEELEADLRKMALDYLAAEGQATDAYQAQLAAEAKLAKTITFLDDLWVSGDYSDSEH